MYDLSEVVIRWVLTVSTNVWPLQRPYTDAETYVKQAVSPISNASIKGWSMDNELRNANDCT
jgi:hypothetical protein